MVGSMKMDKNIEKKLETAVAYSRKIQQPRSNFQIKNFVVGQHETDEMQFYQTCLEISEGYFNLKIAELELEKLKLKKEEFLSSEDEVDKIDAKIASLAIERLEGTVQASKKELIYLLEIYNSFEVKYTREEIENNQYIYWQERLHRQATLEQVAVSTAQSEHFNSLRQIGLIDVSNNQTQLGLNFLEKKKEKEI